MKIAIMQPYFMPFIGYFQLINEVDKFVFYDDVNFIKQGWINRNKMLINGQANMFSVPLKNASSHTLIKDILISDNEYEKWKKSFLDSIAYNYKKSKNYQTVKQMIEIVLHNPPQTISELAIKSIIEVSEYLNLNTEFSISSKAYNNAHLSGQNRVLDICQRESADIYINSIGGKDLYSAQEFINKNIELLFIQCDDVVYPQFSAEFVSFLSIIDVLMFNTIDEVKMMLKIFILK